MFLHTKIAIIVATGYVFWAAGMPKMLLWLGSAPDLTGGVYSARPDPLAAVCRYISKATTGFIQVLESLGKVTVFNIKESRISNHFHHSLLIIDHPWMDFTVTHPAHWFFFAKHGRLSWHWSAFELVLYILFWFSFIHIYILLDYDSVLEKCFWGPRKSWNFL